MSAWNDLWHTNCCDNLSPVWLQCLNGCVRLSDNHHPASQGYTRNKSWSINKVHFHCQAILHQTPFAYMSSCCIIAPMSRVHKQRCGSFKCRSIDTIVNMEKALFTSCAALVDSWSKQEGKCLKLVFKTASWYLESKQDTCIDHTEVQSRQRILPQDLHLQHFTSLVQTSADFLSYLISTPPSHLSTTEAMLPRWQSSYQAERKVWTGGVGTCLINAQRQAHMNKV